MLGMRWLGRILRGAYPVREIGTHSFCSNTRRVGGIHERQVSDEVTVVLGRGNEVTVSRGREVHESYIPIRPPGGTVGVCRGDKRHIRRYSTVVVLRIRRIASKLWQECTEIKQVCSGCGDHPRITQPAESFIALWAIGYDFEGIVAHCPGNQLCDPI